jgi:glucose/arabinose dehydrogenase
MPVPPNKPRRPVGVGESMTFSIIPGGGGPLPVALALLYGLAVSGPALSFPTRSIETRDVRLRVETLASGLQHPWGLAFLPDGQMLVTERPGRLRIVSPAGDISQSVGGLPEVYGEGEGGLLDVALDPEFSSNNLTYVAYAELGDGGASIAVARGRLAGGALRDVQVIFRQLPKVRDPIHFGSRLAFDRDGKLLITLGDRFEWDGAQDLSNHLGKIARINRDGSIPTDNPFVDRTDARPDIWSYGHRNVEGAAIHPKSGLLWISELGPVGGDELNVIQAGRNYGWPLVSWGHHIGGAEIPNPQTRPDLTDAIYHWTPVISPSGMSFYMAGTIPQWQGNLLVGGLSARALVRLILDGDRVVDEERIDMGGRVRNVRQGPDGAVYILIDAQDGRIERLSAEDVESSAGLDR